jgi:hypothetical protein
MPSRRSLLGASAAVVAAPLLAYAARSVALADTVRPAVSSLPLVVVNHTYRYTNAQIYVYGFGNDPATGQQAYLKADGTLGHVALSDNGSSGYTDYAIPLAADGDTTLHLPNMSGRIYLAIGDKLKVRVVSDGNGNPALQYPAGWVSSDPNYPVLHDWMEFTFNGSGMFCNTTMVDMFSIPMALHLSGAQSQTAGTLVSGGRANIFSAMSAQPTFANLVVTGDRIIAPGHGIDSGVFPANYLDGYVNDTWTAYQSKTLTVNANGATYTGTVSGGTFNFSGGVASFAKPSTKDVFYCAGALAAPNDGKTGPVAAVLGAGLNRSTLRDVTTQPTTDPAGFYQQSTTNHYARIMHANSADGKAYGFPFDDVAGFASYIQDTSPSSLTLELTPF